LREHKPWFYEEWLHCLDQWKQVKMKWLQVSNQNNIDNMNNVRHEESRHFRNKKQEYLKAKIDELETNSKIKNTRLV
jgi:hypothetical protein